MRGVCIKGGIFGEGVTTILKGNKGVVFCVTLSDTVVMAVDKGEKDIHINIGKCEKRREDSEQERERERKRGIRLEGLSIIVESMYT